MPFFLLAFPALFSIINPIGGSFVFLTLTRHYPSAVRAQLARWVSIYAFAIVIGSVYIGAHILDFFGISIPVLRVAGGLVIATAGWRVLNAPDDVRPRQDSAVQDGAAALTEHDTLRRMAFYPLAMPLTTGPGTIAVAVSLGVARPRQIGLLFNFIWQTALAALCICAAIYVLYRYSDRVSRFIGPTGTVIIQRLSAFLLLCIGVQVLWSGIAELIATQTVPTP
jgi:multiple antibiotic resistance protein